LGGLDAKKELLMGIKHLYIIGCGTSYYAGLFAKRIFHLLGSFETIQVIEGSEFSEIELSDESSGVILITQSGQTADVYRALEIAKSKGMPTLGVVNSVGSQIATEVDCGVYLNAGREVAVPSTKTFTCSILALILIGIWFSHHRGEKSKLSTRNELIMTLHALPTVVGKTLIDVEGPSEKIAKLLEKENDLYLLAKGPAAAIAKEGALKLKEIAYIHAESFVSGEIKHGPIALIDSGTPLATKVLLIILNDSTYTDMQHALTEVKANHAHTIVITDCPEKLPKAKTSSPLVDDLIIIPHLGVLTPLLAVLPLQKIGYKLALLRNLNPDKPRNLAKTVTVH
jgi:glucosamine--fructose-6-phosphate aminotransferase (isomerizing)